MGVVAVGRAVVRGVGVAPAGGMVRTRKTMWPMALTKMVWWQRRCCRL